MRRHAITWKFLAATLVPAALVAQRQRPDVLAPQTRDTAALRFRAERVRAGLPELTLWAPPSDRFDRMDYAHVFFSVDRDAYVAVFEVGTDGRIRVIYPRSPRENLLVRAGAPQRVLAGAGFYPDGPGARQVPYVFAVASFRPFDLSEFGNGRRWQYQLASVGHQTKSPELTIRRVAELLFGESDAEIAADYLYFATGAQVRRASALRALDRCNGSAWDGVSFSDIGTDYFFSNYFVPLWELYVPFGGWSSSFVGSYNGCAQRSLHARRTLAWANGAPATPATPTEPAAEPGVPGTRVDGESGPRGQEPERQTGPRRSKVDGDEGKGSVNGRVAPAAPVMAEDMGIAPEPLRVRNDRRFETERDRMIRGEGVADRRRRSAEGSYDQPSRRSRPESASGESPSTSRGRASNGSSSASTPVDAPSRSAATEPSSSGKRTSPRSAKEP